MRELFCALRVLKAMWLATEQRSNGPQSHRSADRKKDPLEVPESRCSHFSIATGRLRLPGAIQPLRVPIYRCRLAVELVARLRGHEDGSQSADVIAASPIEGLPRLLRGPDLEAISAGLLCRTPVGDTEIVSRVFEAGPSRPAARRSLDPVRRGDARITQ